MRPSRAIAIGIAVSGLWLLQLPAWAGQPDAVLRVLVPESWGVAQPLTAGDRRAVPPSRLWFYDSVQAFRKAVPTAKLEFEAAATEQLAAAFLKTSMAGHPPDIVVLPNGPQSRLARAGHLAPLDRFASDWPDFNEYLLRDNMSVDGKVYLVPGPIVPHVLLYNKELYAKAGIKEAPKTWDELIAVAKKLTRDGGRVWGFGWPAGSAHPAFVAQNLVTLVWQQGGKLEDKGRGLIDTPEMRKAIQLYVQLVHVHKVMPESATAWDQQYMANFRSEKLAMTVRGAEEYAASLPALGAKVGIAPVPVFRSDERSYTWVDFFGFGMSTRAAEAKPGPAWALLKQLGSEETFALAAEHQKAVSPRRSMGQSPIYRSSPEFALQARYAAEVGRARPPIDEWEAWTDVLARTVQTAVLRTGKVEDLLPVAQRDYEGRLKR